MEEKNSKFSTGALISLSIILLGAIVFAVGLFSDIMFLGVFGFLLGIGGIISLIFTTHTGAMVFVAFGILCVFAILAFFGPVRMVYCIEDIVDYHNNKAYVTEIFATVTEVKETASGDGGSDYYSYVSYTYDDISYSNVFWKYGEAEIGANVKVPISTQKPNEIFDSGTERYTSIIFPAIITAFAVIAIIRFPYKEFLKKKSK